MDEAEEDGENDYGGRVVHVVDHSEEEHRAAHEDEGKANELSLPKVVDHLCHVGRKDHRGD